LGAGLIAGAQPVPAVPAAAAIRGSDMVTIPNSGAGDGPRPTRIRILSPGDHDLFIRAFEACEHGDWVAARNLASQGQHPLARRLVEWRYALDKNSGATFAEIDAAIKDTEAKTPAATWPLRGTLQARAEAQITPELPPATIAAWFAARTPNSSIGKIRYGEALVATGDKVHGGALIRSGWAEGSFDLDIEQAILQKDATFLTPDSDRVRLDNLLWRGDITGAKRQVMRVDAAAADIANARIGLNSYGLPKAQAAADKVRGSGDPDLLFDWSHALRMAERNREAHDLLLKVPAAPMVKDHLARWWAEINVQARDALSGGDPRLALELVEHAGLSAGDQYVEQQFLTGFIALRFLKEPAPALAAFQRLDAAVARPISKSRAQYWQGRAHEALGDTAAALTHYRQAALYPETFYGQVALARIDASPVLHLNETAVEAVSPGDVENDPLMPQIKILAELGQVASLRLFVDRDIETYPSPRHIKRLMLLLTDWGYPEIAVRLAKGLSYAGTMLPAFTHPVIALPPYTGPGEAPEPALVLGLIRQETEFDAYAISSAGARGLMQMMLGSAKTAAKLAKLPYRPTALLGDTRYNMQLGMTEYRGHLDRYGGSWVLAAAAYNAGPNNAKKWLVSNGDPRTSDPIDWIEQIPFGETRNYVQRVLENAQVYRARLAGKDAPLKILQNLYAPGRPEMPILAAK
jgi:soluble lytic murein transglycosylase